MDPRLNVYGPTLIVLAEYKGLVYSDGDAGITLESSSVRRNSPATLDSKIHHNNLLNNILAKIEANVGNADDAIMLDCDRFVADKNATNVFAIKDREVLTPSAVTRLPGLTHNIIIKLAKREGLQVQEDRISISEFYTADEDFTMEQWEG